MNAQLVWSQSRGSESQLTKDGEGTTYIWGENFIITLLIKVRRFGAGNNDRIDPFYPASTEVPRGNYTKRGAVIWGKIFPIHLCHRRVSSRLYKMASSGEYLVRKNHTWV